MSGSSISHPKEAGVPHWKWQRRSALVLIPLTLWLLYSLVHHIGAEYSVAQAWVSNPFVALLLIVFVIALFYHGKLGLQVIIEDYISELSVRKSVLRISSLLCWLAIAIGVVSIIKIVMNG